MEKISKEQLRKNLEDAAQQNDLDHELRESFSKGVSEIKQRKYR